MNKYCYDRMTPVEKDMMNVLLDIQSMLKKIMREEDEPLVNEEPVTVVDNDTDVSGC